MTATVPSHDTSDRTRVEYARLAHRARGSARPRATAPCPYGAVSSRPAVSRQPCPQRRSRLGASGCYRYSDVSAAASERAAQHGLCEVRPLGKLSAVSQLSGRWRRIRRRSSDARVRVSCGACVATVCPIGRVRAPSASHYTGSCSCLYHEHTRQRSSTASPHNIDRIAYMRVRCGG